MVTRFDAPFIHPGNTLDFPTGSVMSSLEFPAFIFTLPAFVFLVSVSHLVSLLFLPFSRPTYNPHITCVNFL